jgi:hypothetical protein
MGVSPHRRHSDAPTCLHGLDGEYLDPAAVAVTAPARTEKAVAIFLDVVALAPGEALSRPPQNFRSMPPLSTRPSPTTASLTQSASSRISAARTWCQPTRPACTATRRAARTRAGRRARSAPQIRASGT